VNSAQRLAVEGNGGGAVLSNLFEKTNLSSWARQIIYLKSEFCSISVIVAHSPKSSEVI